MRLLQPTEGLVCGVDEAGRGPLAGPVVAAAVILDPACPIDGLDDSKKLTAKRREALAVKIRAKALGIPPSNALIDGNRCPQLACPAQAIIGGDGKVASIAAASILAKTFRDAGMLELHAIYPQYGFDQHKGYPTPAHLRTLREHGVSAVHRRSYAPVAQLILL